MMTLWKASRDDVWCSGDKRVMSLHMNLFVTNAVSLSLDFVSTQGRCIIHVYSTVKNVALYL